MAAIWPAATAATLDLLTPVNNTKVTLTVDAAVGDTTLTVDDASQLPASGYLTFDDNATNPETIYYSGRTSSNLTGVTRGADGTSAASHASAGSTTHIEQRWNAAYHTVHSAEIIAIETDLTTRLGHDAGSHQILSSDGTVSLPQYSFAADPDTGVYRIGANDLALATAGTKALEINATQQVVIPKTTNQLVLGTTNTSTISATAPSVSRTLTIPDPGADASFIMSVGNATLSLTTSLTVAATSNQLVLGGAAAAKTITITAPTPATSNRTWTIPDLGADATFMALGGTQTVSGAKTFSAVALFADGSQSAPGIAFSTETGSGLYRIGAADLALSVTNTKVLEAKTTGVAIKGTTTNDNAALGFVGEVISGSLARSAQTALSTGTAKTVVSIILTAGDWDIRGMVGFRTGAGATTITDLDASISLTDNAVSGSDTEAVAAGGEVRTSNQYAGTALSPGAGNDIGCPTLITRASLTAATTTFYLVALASFGVSTLNAYGHIFARRIR